MSLTGKYNLELTLYFQRKYYLIHDLAGGKRLCA